MGVVAGDPIQMDFEQQQGVPADLRPRSRGGSPSTLLVQILSTEQFLPVAPKKAETVTAKRNDYIYEPGKAEILREMVPLTLRSHFYRVILDSLAAEHGARMNAMQKATDNATELLKELKLSYNKARQAAITNEIIEIVSGSEALKG